MKTKKAILRALATVLVCAFSAVTGAAEPTAPAGMALATSPQASLSIECVISRGDEIVASPKLIVMEGEPFMVRIGDVGSETFVIKGSVTLGAEEQTTTAIVTEFTVWDGDATKLRRGEASMRSKLGETFVMSGLNGANGKELALRVKVSLAKTG